MEWLKQFYNDHTVEKQIEESNRLRSKYPDRIPILVDRATKRSALLDKHKYLVPGDLTLGQFIAVVRKRIKLQPEKALFFFTEDKNLPPISQLMSVLWTQHANPGKFLVLSYAEEETFGSCSHNSK